MNETNQSNPPQPRLMFLSSTYEGVGV